MSFANLLDSSFLACPMCLSGVAGQGVMAANIAIGVMLIFLFSVLAAFFTFIIYLAKRARRLSEGEMTSTPTR